MPAFGQTDPVPPPPPGRYRSQAIHTQYFRNTIHGIGGKHAGTGTAPRACFHFQFSQFRCRHLAGFNTAYGLKTLFKSTTFPLYLPAGIGPPLTKLRGGFKRAAAISIPGTILSQWG